jgi:hypothetical protein
MSTRNLHPCTLSGHFYSYDSLHLTEVSRAIDYYTKDSLSNQSHPCASLTLVMMLAVLPLLNDYRKFIFIFDEFNLFYLMPRFPIQGTYGSHPYDPVSLGLFQGKPRR